MNVLRQTLQAWFTFYDGYDPLFTWWSGEPYKEAGKALEEYAKFPREKLLGAPATVLDAVSGGGVGAVWGVPVLGSDVSEVAGRPDSLNFHLEKMTPEECVDFLVNRVGHERDNASGEVRRSFDGNYGALYQAAYMLGGLQLRALHRELVGTKRSLTREYAAAWRFY